jgi:hypothetical protein
LRHSPLAFKAKRLGDDSHGDGTNRPSNAGNNRSATGSCATALARCDKNHIGPSQSLLNLLMVVLGSSTADLGVGSRTKTAGEFTPNIELHIGITQQKCLGVSVDGDEFHATQSSVDHAVDCIHTATSDTHHFDDCEVIVLTGHRYSLSFNSQPLL